MFLYGFKTTVRVITLMVFFIVSIQHPQFKAMTDSRSPAIWLSPLIVTVHCLFFLLFF